MKLGKLVSDKNFGTSFQSLMKLKGIEASSIFALRGIVKIISEETVKYNESRTALIEEYAERDEKGEIVRLSQDSVKIKAETSAELNKKLFDLSNIDVEIPEIKYSTLGKEPDLNAEDIIILEFIVQ